MDLTLHLVAERYYESQDSGLDYLPAAFAQAGFIHCTDAPAEMARVANLFYRQEAGPQLYLYIDKSRVHAPLRYDDAGGKYPHIYGPLNRDAIIGVRPVRRDADGAFLAPEPLPDMGR